VTANPASKFTLLDITPVETTTGTISTLSTVMGGVTPTTAVTSIAGTNLHYRAQFIFPAYYHAAIEDRKFAFAIAIVAGAQVDGILRQSYQMNVGAITDIGPVVTLGRKFLQDDALSIGLSARFAYRLGTQSSMSLLNVIQGSSLTSGLTLGDGTMINGDFGLTYRIAKFGEFEFNTGAAIQNILGGTYSNSISLVNQGAAPEQARSYGVGFSLFRPSWGFLGNTVFALEITDVLNNRDGSIFKMLHLGAETRWKSIALRLGLNQGYWTAGLGIDAHYFTMNLATYGEELGLNAGTLEDRRYSFNFGFHI
jgi:hypothetical protein